MATSDDWRSLYPFQSREVILGGHRCHYVDEGAGEVLLLVHGNPTWSFYWREIIRAMRDRYRVVAMDHIGCGLSDKPSPREYSYRLARRVADLNELIEKLDLRKITLVAHDWGGAIGMGAAVAAADRFARFVLMNTAAFRTPRCPWSIRACRLPVFGPLLVQGLNLFARGALRSTVCKRERMTPAVRAGYLAPYDSWRHRAAILRFVLDIPLHPGHPSYETLCEDRSGPGPVPRPARLPDLGHARLVFHAPVPRPLSRFLAAGGGASPGGRGTLRGGRRPRADRSAAGGFLAAAPRPDEVPP